MAAQLSEAAALANDPELIGPLTAAIVRNAIATMNEDPGADNHEARVFLAKQVLGDPGFYATRFTWAVSTNDVIVDQWASGDHEAAFTDLQFVVNTVWDSVAGVTS